jgi:STE24 endopeptidase
MNIFAVIILFTLLLDYFLNLTADYLNLKSLDQPLPDEFRDVIDEDTYEKSKEYTQTRTRFGFITGTFDLFVLLIFWFAGGFNWLDQVVQAFGYGVIGTGLFYIGALVLFKILTITSF